MGGCLSKKSTSSSCPTALPTPNTCSNANLKPAHQQIKPQIRTQTQTPVEKKESQEETVKKEIFIIKHRKSHDIDRGLSGEEEKDDVKKAVTEIVLESEKIGSGNDNDAKNNGGVFVAAPVRTSSCTKEELDAILIQCGRLSRSSSTGKTANLSGSCGSGENTNGNNPLSSQRGRKYSGSKRSYDFDNDNGSEGKDNVVVAGADDDDNGVVGERSHRHRQRQRQTRMVGSPSKGRRRTPSREREQQGQQQRSGSRERGHGSSGSGRRVSRSPGRRSESPITTATSSGVNSSSGNGNGGNGNRPGKMVSVPATVSSLVMDKSNNASGVNETISSAAVKRIQVKRNAGGGGDAVGARTAASPRARSPARGNVRVLNENQSQNQQQPGSLSRSNSRKAEHSPYRRNPLSEIDTNVVIEQMPGTKAPNNNLSQAPIQKPNSDYTMNNKVAVQGAENKISSSKGMADKNMTNLNCKLKEQQHVISEVAKEPQAITSNVAANMVASGPECLKPQAITRSRSSRLSRDFDIDPETLSNPSPSYTALLLEDIQNFHQKSNAPAISLPPCLSKACSILEAVADLNSTTSSNLPSALSEDKRRIPTVEEFNKLYDNVSFGPHHPAGKKGSETRAPIMQSEVVVSDDIMEPTFHKYVTVSRGGGIVGGEDMEEQESSGSNSFVGGQQYWVSPSAWEPNSADSTDGWTSSRSNIREDSVSPLGIQRHAVSETGHATEEARRRLSGKKRDSDQQQNGIGRGRIGSRGLHSVPTATAAST